MAIPQGFRSKMETMYGESGRAWLLRLPSLLAELEQAWEVTLEAPFNNLSYTYVAPAVGAGGERFVLKIAHPRIELEREAAALRHFGGRGICKIHQDDRQRQAILLEELSPGEMLLDAPLPEREKVRITAEVMQNMWRPAPTAAGFSFPTIYDWTDQLDRMDVRIIEQTAPQLLDRFELARQAARILRETGQEAPNFLLHGDLHHQNILSADRATWLAIDPKGVTGEPAFEPAQYLCNPFPQLSQTPDLPTLMAERIAGFAEFLQLSPLRIGSWGFVKMMLGLWWSIEDHESDWVEWDAIAESLVDWPKGLLRLSGSSNFKIHDDCP